MGDDQDAPSGSNEGGNRFVHDTVMHQFSHVTGNGHGAGMETVSMTHQPPIVQRNDNERPSISTEYPKDPVLGPDGAVTRNAGNTVQTTNQLLTPDQFFRYSNYQVQDTEVTPLLRLAPPTLQQPPPLPQGPAANGNNGTLWPAGVIVAGPSEQMPLVRPNDMPVAPSERQAADDSAEHQEMRDMLIAQIRQGLQHLRRQSDTIEHNPLHNFSEDDEDNDDEDERNNMLEALRHLGRQSDAILEILSDDDDDDDDIEDEDNDDSNEDEDEEDMSLDIDDLSLDLDNMSLEGLLELEEDIETVSSQLHEENIETVSDIIQANLRQHKYQPVKADSPADGDCCCVCLEEYAAGDDIGKLDNCVHVYHVTCITLWLKKKNSCPACKAVALNALE